MRCCEDVSDTHMVSVTLILVSDEHTQGIMTPGVRIIALWTHHPGEAPILGFRRLAGRYAESSSNGLPHLESIV